MRNEKAEPFFHTPGQRDDDGGPGKKFGRREEDFRPVQRVADRPLRLADDFGRDAALPAHAERKRERALKMRDKVRQIEMRDAAPDGKTEGAPHFQKLSVH